MKVSDIISRVRNIAGDNEVLQFKDDSIIAWINDAMREVASDNQLLQKSATSNTVANTGEYAIPEDILKLHTIKYDGEPLTVITMEQAKEYGSAVGTPNVSWVWAGKLNLYPAPDSAKSLRIDYTRQPTEVTGEQDTPEIPAAYHMRLIDYCLAQVAQQDDDMNRYAIKMDEFRSGVQSLKDQPEWENNQYPYMGVSDRDSGGYYYDEY